MIKKIKQRFSFLDVHTKEVIKKSFSSSIVKIAGMFIGLLVSVAVGRLIGAEGLGIINLSHRIVTVLVIFSLCGMMQVIVKEVAIVYSQRNTVHIRNVMYTSYVLNGVLATLLL